MKGESSMKITAIYPKGSLNNGLALNPIREEDKEFDLPVTPQMVVDWNVRSKGDIDTKHKIILDGYVWREMNRVDGEEFISTTEERSMMVGDMARIEENGVSRTFRCGIVGWSCESCEPALKA
jgi:hypothetical protein